MSIKIIPNSEANDSEMSILKRKEKLLVAFYRMSHLSKFEKITGVKVYLSYLISTQKIQVQSVAELQAFLYRLSKMMSENNESSKKITAKTIVASDSLTSGCSSTAREHFSDYLILSDRALDISVNNIIDKLLGVVFEVHKTSLQNSLMYRMLQFVGWTDLFHSSNSYEPILKYHKKGLFVSDCKKLFLKEIMRNVP